MNNSTILQYELPDVNRKEVFRYLRSSTIGQQETALLDEMIEKTKGIISNKVVFREFGIKIHDNLINLGFAEVKSENLALNLKDCERIILFAATAGNSFERIIKMYSATSPAKGAFCHALGSERVEALCDAFNDDMRVRMKQQGYVLKPRFSPGYGDLDISVQKDIFDALNCTLSLGITLDNNFYMTPSKSVTAIIGCKRMEEEK